MAECHPVGFGWVMEAKARGAKVIHVDPRFPRTSAVADLHVPIRAGSDIAFLGGIVNFILENGRDFRDYVRHYTNAGAIVDERFRDTEDLDGLFSGWDPERGAYDPSSVTSGGTRSAASGRATTAPTSVGSTSRRATCPRARASPAWKRSAATRPSSCSRTGSAGCSRRMAPPTSTPRFPPTSARFREPESAGACRAERS
jgi:formate dehydrogenase major subunit